MKKPHKQSKQKAVQAPPPVSLSPVFNLVTPKEAARMLGVAESTLAAWRCLRRYQLPFVKVGSRVKYRASAIEEFLNSRGRGAAA
jgi:excisionase family DNA binding protein